MTKNSRVIPAEKRAGARAFGPSRSRDFENYFFPSNKRHETFRPYYYYYQQPKRAGARTFYTYWNPLNTIDTRFNEESPFYAKRSVLRDSDDYSY
ncbi:unnamed protein product [Thelazia callipaeda]|uniref:Uncharacterized protein n=1 Tax=Thelazia callipaeda TaxID=103827 RepID=A0A0N5D287_THECL|nr:unnamed protein product [Thelazia callipaeda]